MSDLIHDIGRHEYNDKDKVSLDFRLNVPTTPHEDLKSSATIKDGSVKNFELRLGLLSKERYDPDEIRSVMDDILADMDLPDHARPMENDRDPVDEIDPKISYDPHWGAIGFYQIHLKCATFFPLAMDEDEFEAFVREFVPEFIERVEWDDPAETDERYDDE